MGELPDSPVSHSTAILARYEVSEHAPLDTMFQLVTHNTGLLMYTILTSNLKNTQTVLPNVRNIGRSSNSMHFLHQLLTLTLTLKYNRSINLLERLHFTSNQLLPYVLEAT